MRTLIFLGLLTASFSQAQVSVGLIGGAPFTDVVNSVNMGSVQYAAQSANFTVGPSLRVALPASLRFEVDALYRPYSFSASGVANNPSGSQWSFPVMLQYRLKTPIVKPFVGGGVAFSRLTGITSAVAAGPAKFLQSSDAGVVLGLGADVKIPFVTFSGEFRYSRQGNYFSGLSNLNQAELLFGIHF